MRIKVIIKKGEDGYYIAECPFLEGCISQGKTVEEALENIKEAIELWIETYNDYIKKKYRYGRDIKEVVEITV